MNVLFISVDSTLLAEEEKKISGDARYRLIEYGKYFSKIFVAVCTKKNFKKKILSNNIFIYPISGNNHFSPLHKGYRICSNIIKKEKIDAILTQDPFLTGITGYLLKKRYKIPLIIALHGDYLDNKYWIEECLINKFYNKIGKFILKRGDAWRVDSIKIKNHLISEYGFPPQKIFVFPIYINVEKFYTSKEPNAIRQKYSSYDNIILFIGRLAKQKNVGNLLRAVPSVLKEFPKTLFLIVGTGGEEKQLKRMADELNIVQNVKFEGFVDHDRIPEYLHACDIFVLPSNYEGRATVLVEAMACEKSVICTDISGARDVIINGENGYVVSQNNHIELAQKIIYLLKNPEERTEIGKIGKRTVERQDIKRNAGKLREMFDEVLEIYSKNRKIE